MIDDVVGALNGRTWPAYVHEKHGPRIGELVGPTLRPVVGAVVEPAGPVPGGCCGTRGWRGRCSTGRAS